MTIREPGGPDVLEPAQVPDPTPADGEVLVRVAAAGVNRADVMQRLGHYPPPEGEPAWPGLEVSGTVEALGEGVQDWSVGDEVCALLGGGGYAELVTVPAAQLLPVPAGVGLVEAAALPEVDVHGLVERVHGRRPAARRDPARARRLQRHRHDGGAAGARPRRARGGDRRVGRQAGALRRARRRRARELPGATTSSSEVREATDGRGADVVLDNMGATYLARNVDVLATGGRLVVIGLQGGTRGELDLGLMLRKRVAVMATSLRARPAAEKAAIVRQVRELVWPLLADGTVRPVVHATFALDDAARAHAVLEESSHVGKLLLVV